MMSVEDFATTANTVIDYLNTIDDDTLPFRPYVLHECENGYYIVDTYDRLSDIDWHATKSEVRFLAKDRVVFVKRYHAQSQIFVRRPFVNNLFTDNEEELQKQMRTLGRVECVSYDLFFAASCIKQKFPDLDPTVYDAILRSYLSGLRYDLDVYLAYLRFSLENIEDEDAEHQRKVLQELIEDHDFAEADRENAANVLLRCLTKI